MTGLKLNWTTLHLASSVSDVAAVAVVIIVAVVAVAAARILGQRKFLLLLLLHKWQAAMQLPQRLQLQLLLGQLNAKGCLPVVVDVTAVAAVAAAAANVAAVPIGIS